MIKNETTQNIYIMNGRLLKKDKREKSQSSGVYLQETHRIA